MTAARYQVRRASSTGAVAVVDTVAETVEREYPAGGELAAFDYCDELNAAERRFAASEHTAAAFAAQWRGCVNG